MPPPRDLRHRALFRSDHVIYYYVAIPLTAVVRVKHRHWECKHTRIMDSLLSLFRSREGVY
jgi:hypothetical protein